MENKREPISYYVAKIENGALVNAPIWESDRRGKSWFAAITPDPKAPGGLARDFADSADGDYYYLVPGWLKENQAVEFGADYYSRGGKANRDRWYGVVLAILPDQVIFEVTETARQAVRRSAELSEPRILIEDPRLRAVMDIRSLMKKHNITLLELEVWQREENETAETI